MKNVLQINGVIQKVDESEINEAMVEFIQDKILDILDEQGYMFGGSWLHQTTDEYIKEIDTIEIKGTEYDFTILPRFGNVKAEIHYKTDGGPDIHLIDKDFGSMWRKPIKSDYIKARKWIELQFDCMKESNKNI